MVSGFHCFPISLPAKKRDPEFLANSLAAPLMIKMAVGEDMTGESPTPQVLQEAPATEASPGVYEDSRREIDIYQVRLEQRNPCHAVAHRNGLHSNPQPGNPAQKRFALDPSSLGAAQSSKARLR